jgi:hypothetical protein
VEIFRPGVCASAAILVAVTLLSVPYAQGEDSDVLIERALKLSGLSGQIKMLDRMLLSSIPADAFPDLNIRNKAAKFLKQVMGEDTLLTMVQTSLKDDCKGDLLKKVLDFYNSKLGNKVGRLQSIALEPSLLRNIREGRKTFAALDDRRMMVLKRIIHAEGVTEDNAKSLRSFIRGLIDGFSDETDNRAERMRITLKAIENTASIAENRTEEIAMLAFAHTFQTLSDKDLDELAHFQESEAAAWFRSAVRKGVTKAVYETAKALGKAMHKP